MEPVTKIAFPTDEHFPFQDENARSVALQIISDFDPDEMIVGSDGLDFYAVSSFDKDPYLKGDPRMQYGIDQWTRGQREWITAAPRARRRFLVGNHEDRLYRWLSKNPEIADLEVMKLSSILRFDPLRIEGEPEYEFSFFDTLLYRHGQYARQYSAYSAKAELEHQRYSINMMTGHTHRGGTYITRTRRGILQGNECFCLCKLESHYNRTKQLVDWAQGTVLATVGPNWLSIEAIPFFTYLGKTVAIWRGKEYRQS